MKKIFDKKIIFSFVLGVILCGGVVYGVNYKANDISYTKDGKETNVSEALDDLYNKTDESLDKLVLFENGEWKNTDVLKFNLYNSTIRENKLYLGITQGSGIYATRDIKLNTLGYVAIGIECYKDVSNDSAVQMGMANSNGTLPSMISSGTNRVHFTGFTLSLEKQMIPFPLGEYQTFFFGNIGNSGHEIIVEKIYLFNLNK